MIAQPVPPWTKPSSGEFLIAPSLLSADFARLKEEVDDVTHCGADWLHVDVMDGHFVPNLTLGPFIVQALRRVTRLPLDCHLMIENPERWVEEFARAGADGITIHVETTSDPRALLQRIRSLGCRSGITLRPGTGVDEILPFLDVSDLALVMTVEPGFGGQSFMTDQVDKIHRLRNEIDGRQLSTLIQVDGGVASSTLEYLSEADCLVAGSSIFKLSDRTAAIQSLRRKMGG